MRAQSRLFRLAIHCKIDVLACQIRSSYYNMTFQVDALKQYERMGCYANDKACYQSKPILQDYNYDYDEHYRCISYAYGGTKAVLWMDRVLG